MIEVPTDPNATPESLDELVSLWTFGGTDRQGQRHAELWRGTQDLSGQDPVFRFALIDDGNGPSARSGAALIADVERRRLILIGGSVGQNLLAEMWVHELETNKWTLSEVSLPPDLGLEGTAVVMSGGAAYLYGGQTAQGDSNQLWQMDLSTLELEALTEEYMVSSPGPRSGASVAIDPLEEVLYVYGGQSWGWWNNDLFAFDLHSQTWEQLAWGCDPVYGWCPPRSEDATLLTSVTPGAITVAVGTPIDPGISTPREWRFMRAGRVWVTEEEARNVRLWQQ
jgi:hypothetical protein